MVKGISKQVIVVHSPDRKLFEQAIFILSDEAIDRNGVTDEMLLKEAKAIINTPAGRKRKPVLHYLAYTSAGAILTGAIWLLSVIW